MGSDKPQGSRAVWLSSLTGRAQIPIKLILELRIIIYTSSRAPPVWGLHSTIDPSASHHHLSMIIIIIVRATEAHREPIRNPATPSSVSSLHHSSLTPPINRHPPTTIDPINPSVVNFHPES